MSKNIPLMLAACMLVSLLSFDAEALLGLAATAQHSSPNITLVRGFCGLGFHREYGHCIRNGTAYVPPVVVTPHVVVTPQVGSDAPRCSGATLYAARGSGAALYDTRSRGAVRLPPWLLSWGKWSLSPVLRKEVVNERPS